jgi:hypothetical protein
VQRLIFSRSYKLRADKLIGAPGNAARPWNDRSGANIGGRAKPIMI